MADPDHLRELRRQRTLIAGHLAWLDQEIERSAPPSLAPPSEVSAARPPAISPISPSDAQAENLINQWVEEEQGAEALISKTGCWLVFAATILLIVGAVVTFILLKY